MRIAVFVERGKKSWKFRAYSTWFNESWDGCNMVDVPEDVPRSKAKAVAVEILKSRMDLTSQLIPRGIRCCSE